MLIPDTSIKVRNSFFFVTALQFSDIYFGHFWQRSYKNTKVLRHLCLNFPSQDGQEGKKTGKKITQLK